MKLLNSLYNTLRTKLSNTHDKILNNKKLIVNIGLSILLFIIIILNSGYTLTYLNEDTFSRSIVALVSFIIVLLIYSFRVDFSIVAKKFKAKKPPINLLILVGVGVSALLTMLTSGETNDLIYYITFGIQILSAYVIAQLFNFEKFIDVFQTGMVIISLFAIFFDVITIISGTPFSPINTFTGKGVSNVYENYFYISFQTMSSGRLQGPFWEPGLFATFLLLALTFEIIFYKKIRKTYFFIYLIALILTMSTFGYLLLFFILVLLAYKKIHNIKIFSILVFALFAIGISLFVFADSIIPFLAKVFPTVFRKMVKDNGKIQLLDFSRYSSPIYNFEIWLKRPIFGNGIATANSLFSSLHPGVSQTSTITFYLAEFGIFGLIFTVFFIFGICKINKIDVVEKIILIILYLVILNKEPHNGIIFDWIVMFLLIKEFLDKDCVSLAFDEPQPRCIASSFGKKDDASIVKRNIAISYLIKGIAILLGFFSYPIYMRYFSNESVLGVWLTVLSLMSIVLTFDFGLANGLKNNLIKAIVNNNRDEQSKLISSTYYPTFIISAVIIVISAPLIFATNLNNFLGISESIISPTTLKISAFIVVISIAIELTLRNVNSLLQAKQKQGISNLFPLLSTLLLMMFALMFKSNNQETLLLAIAIAYFFAINIPMLIGTFVTLKKYYPQTKIIPSNIDKLTIKRVMSLGLGFFIIQLFLLVLTGTNEIIISNIFTSNTTVEFTNYNKPFIMIYSLFSIITLPMWAIIAKEKEEKNYSEIKRNFKKCLIFLIVFELIALFLSVIYQPFVNLWLGKNVMKVNYWIILIFNIYIFELILSSSLVVVANGFSVVKQQIIFFAIGASIKIICSVILKFIEIPNKSWPMVIIINAIAYIPIIIGLILINLKLFKNMKKDTIHEKEGN